jgi:hypothetical protein
MSRFISQFFTLPCHRRSPANVVAHRRFLKARGYSASQAKQMILDCIQWRRTVEDIGIEELYRSIDPFDVRSVPSLLHPFPCVFRNVSDLRRSLLPHSFPDGRVSLRAGQWVSTRYAPRPHFLNAHTTPNQCPASDPSLFKTDKVTLIRFSAYMPLSDLSIVYSSAVPYISRASVR